jgi:DNA (cytosine-5)-methyltransferase 1
LQGFPDGWTYLPKYADDPDKLDSARYHACGNAVTVNVIEWIGQRLLAAVFTTEAVRGAEAVA